MVENVTQTKFGIMINVGVGTKMLKNIMCAKKVIFGILLYALVKMANI